MAYFASKDRLINYEIVEADPDNPGMIKKQQRKLGFYLKLSMKQLDSKVIGFVEPDIRNGMKIEDSYVYNINIEENWRRYDH